MNKLTHIDINGKARMVDIGEKGSLVRLARAGGTITLSEQTILMIKENTIQKGDVLTVAEIAGIQAAKQTSNLIPLCHSLITDQILVTTKITETGVDVECTVRCTGKTGVEMEALTGASIALLTIYDMCKAVDKNMFIKEIKLLEKIKHNENSTAV